MAEWTKDQLKQLRTLAREKKTREEIGNVMGRSPEAIDAKARREKIRITSARPARPAAKKAKAKASPRKKAA